MVPPGALTGHRRIGIDTTVFIYALEHGSPFTPTAQFVLRLVEAGHVSAVASTLAIAELLVWPYRHGRSETSDGYFTLLTAYPNLALVAPSLEICRTAARLRGMSPSLKLADAVHLATGIASGATAFVTNDARIPRDLGISVVQLRDVAVN